jgi:hypothetical protein
MKPFRVDANIWFLGEAQRPGIAMIELAEAKGDTLSRERKTMAGARMRFDGGARACFVTGK